MIFISFITLSPFVLFRFDVNKFIDKDKAIKFTDVR